MPEPSITVLLADDHGLVRRGFRRMLEDDPEIAVVAEAGDGQQAVELALELRPRVVVMDFALPTVNGATADFSTFTSLLPPTAGNRNPTATKVTNAPTAPMPMPIRRRRRPIAGASDGFMS